MTEVDFILIILQSKSNIINNIILHSIVIDEKKGTPTVTFEALNDNDVRGITFVGNIYYPNENVFANVLFVSNSITQSNILK